MTVNELRTAPGSVVFTPSLQLKASYNVTTRQVNQVRTRTLQLVSYCTVKLIIFYRGIAAVSCPSVGRPSVCP